MTENKDPEYFDFEGEEKVEEMSTEFGVTIVPGTISLESTKDQLKSFIETVKASYISQPITSKNVVSAKKDLANVRKIGKQVTGKMASVKKELLAPFDALNAEIKSILSGLDEIESEMDTGIKAVAEAEREEKSKTAKAIMAEMLKAESPDVNALLSEYWDDSFSLKSTSEPSMRNKFSSVIEFAKATSENIKGTPHEAQLISVFKQTFSFSSVMDEKNRLEKQDEEYARLQQLRQEQARLAAEKAEAARIAQEEARAKQAQECETTQPEPETPPKSQETTPEPKPELRRDTRVITAPFEFSGSTSDNLEEVLNYACSIGIEVVTSFVVTGTVDGISDMIRFANELGVQAKRTGAAKEA